MDEKYAVRLINTSGRGMGMITIVHAGRSETRHCKPNNGAWTGYFLDADKKALELMASASALHDLRLRALQSGAPVFRSDLLCRYEAGSGTDYHGQVVAEYSRAARIIKEQLAAIELAEAAKAAKEAARLEVARKLAHHAQSGAYAPTA